MTETTKKDAAALKVELKALLDKHRDEKGRLPKRKAYLRSENGKRILEIVLALETSWREIIETLQRSQTRIEKDLSFWKLSKPRQAHTVWSEEKIAYVIKGFDASRNIASRDESSQRFKMLIDELNAMPGRPKQATPASIRTLVRRLNAKRGKDDQIKWGWNSNAASKDGKPTKAARNAVQKEIRERLAARITEGALIDPEIGADKLFTLIRDEFADRLKATKTPFRKADFPALLDTIIWTEGKDGTLTALKRLVKHGKSTRYIQRRFDKYHPRIPAGIVARKARELTGESTAVAHTEFMRGINRIGDPEALRKIDLDEFEVPETSFEEPFEIPVTDPDNWVPPMVINGVNLGIKHGRDIEDNPICHAISNAERIGSEAVILTNTLDIDMTKAAGPLKALRALFSGRNVNIALLSPSYQEKAQKILEGMPDDRFVYEIANEAFENQMGAWFKIWHLPKRKPWYGRLEYTGPTYVVFGYKEEDFVIAATYWHAAYHTIVRQNDLEVERTVAQSGLAAAIVEGDQAKIEEYQKDVNDLSDEIARTRITNIHPQEWERIYLKVLAYVIKRYEEVIPNCKVICLNTAFVKVGNKKIELNIPGHVRVTDMLLSNRVSVHGPDVWEEKLADGVVICHPYPLNWRVTAREKDARGERGHAKFAVAPACVDAKFLRAELKKFVRKVHPAAKTAFLKQSHPGVMLLECHKDTLNLSPISIESLAKYRLRKKDFGGKKHIPLMEHPSLHYIWYLIWTDPHVGHKSRATFWCEELGRRLGVFEAICHSFRSEGYLKDGRTPPIHIASANDDGVQGDHFGAHKQPHPNELSYVDMENLWIETMERGRNAKTRGDLLKLLDDMRHVVLYQMQIRGVSWAANQISEMYERLIEPNIDMFSGILMRAKQSGLIVRGVSDLEGSIKDSRDIGVLNDPNGNHFTRTLDGHLAEGLLFADKKHSLLRGLPQWAGQDKLLKKWVRAPMHGNRFIGYGTVQIPGGYEWGFAIRDKPTGGIDWNDPIRKTVTKKMSRGNVPRVLEGRVLVWSCGDKHFYSVIITPHRIYVMGPPGAETDLFGELGFPPNNTGVLFLGLPIDGPDAGPILNRALLFDDIKRHIEGNIPVEWDKFLINAA